MDNHLMSSYLCEETKLDANKGALKRNVKGSKKQKAAARAAGTLVTASRKRISQHQDTKLVQKAGWKQFSVVRQRGQTKGHVDWYWSKDHKSGFHEVHR